MHNRDEFETSRKESGLGWMARTLMMALGILVGFTLFSSPTNAQTAEQIEAASSNQITHAYSNDPLGLIAYSEETQAYSISRIRPDRIEVYICDTPSGTWEPDRNRLENQLREASSYFRWLSGGLYDPRFVIGGTVSSTEVRGCFEAVERFISQSNSKDITGAIVMTDANFSINPKSGKKVWGWGGPGYICVTGGSSCNYPDNGRDAQVNSNTSPHGSGNQSTNTLVHELGHMVAFPHSFSGDTSEGGQVSEYDNGMDIMSGGDESIKFGTLAINRYAAGWISDEQVAEYSVSESNSHVGRTLRLMPLGQPGLQMLVLPVQPVQPGKFYALGARVQSGYDEDIPKEGVEVYLIDQSESECDSPIRGVCLRTQRRTKPVVAAGNSVDRLGHVYTEGEVIVMDDIRGVRVRVLERRTADEPGYWVWVGPGPLPEGPFHDDEGSSHEMSIDWLATTGITQGCDPKNPYRFCPKDKVTRAQMVAFLGRALGLTATTGDRTLAVNFNDVDPGSEYAGYLDALGSIASGYPDGTFRPDQPITRGEMAVMLNKALKLDADQGRNTEVFTDVPPGTELATAAANLYVAEITKGSTRCRNSSGSEPLFCPDDSLTRDQMAAFFYRSRDFLDLSDDNDGSSAGREVRIRWGDDMSHDPKCGDFVFCRAFSYELIGFGSGPYTLDCWLAHETIPHTSSLSWPGPEDEENRNLCWVRGSIQLDPYVVVDGVESNRLHWDADMEVRISVGEPSTRCPRNEDCWGLHRDYDYKLSDGFGPGPYTLECWARTSGGKWDRLHIYSSWPGSSAPAEGCYTWGESGGQTVHVVVDGVRSNELNWTLSDDVGRMVRIKWGEDLSRLDPECDDFVFCQTFDYELAGDFGPGPHTLECFIGDQRWKSYSLRGREVCRARGNHLIRAYVVVDGVRSSNELHWSRSDDRSDDRRVRVKWGEDLSRLDPECSDFVFCQTFDYELAGDFGPGPHTLECFIGDRRWKSYILRGREVCRARGNHLIRAYVVVDGVRSSNELHWSRSG